MNSKTKFHPNSLGNAVVLNDGKLEFLESLATWFESWSQSSASALTLSKQTSDALIRTLRAQALLAQDLLQEGYSYVLMAKFQSDPVERRFSQYRQLNGGNFLVSLKEVNDSEKIILCRTLIKQNVDFFSGDSLLLKNNEIHMQNLKEELDQMSSEIYEATLTQDSEEVSVVVAGYVAQKLKDKTVCNVCINKLCGDDLENYSYFAHLSRGGLTVPSRTLAQFVSSGFAVLDVTNKLLQRYETISIREAAHYVLKTFCSNVNFTCESHIEWGGTIARKIITNVFYNNKRKLDNDDVRKDALRAFKKRQRTKE